MDSNECCQNFLHVFHFRGTRDISNTNSFKYLSFLTLVFYTSILSIFSFHDKKNFPLILHDRGAKVPSRFLFLKIRVNIFITFEDATENIDLHVVFIVNQFKKKIEEKRPANKLYSYDTFVFVDAAVHFQQKWNQQLKIQFGQRSMYSLT